MRILTTVSQENATFKLVGGMAFVSVVLSFLGLLIYLRPDQGKGERI